MFIHFQWLQYSDNPAVDGRIDRTPLKLWHKRWFPVDFPFTKTCLLLQLNRKATRLACSSTWTRREISNLRPCHVRSEPKKNLSKPWELYFPNLPNILVLMWVKQSHPQFHHFYRWYVYHSQSWVVYHCFTHIV